MFQQRKIKFTKEGFEKVKKDLFDLEEKRKVAVINLQKAREMGDLSENGAYKAARFELSGIDREIRLKKINLRFGEVIENLKSENLDFGNKVVLEYDGKKVEYILVGPQESDPRLGKLSVESPIGRVLIGKKVGDEVKVSLPSGVKIYKILNFE